MTQNYTRPMNAMPAGMPIIPPRFQQQQQQQLVEHHRRQMQQMQQMQHMQHKQPGQPIQQHQNQHHHQRHHQHQYHHQQESLPIQGNHNRSVSNGSNRAKPLLNGHSPSNSSNSNNNNSISSNSNEPSGGSSGHSTHKQTNVHPNGRLRSESNPAYSHSHYNTHHTTNIASGHSRTKSSGGNSVSNSNGSNDGYQSRPPATTTRSNTTGSSFQERMRERDREKRQREREEREAAAKAIDPKLDEILSNQANTTTAAPAQSTGTTLWNKFLIARNVLTGGERWPDSDDSDYEGETHVSRVLREYADKKAAANVAAKIAELEMAPSSPTLSKAPSSGTRRNRYLQDAGQRENDSPRRDLASNNDYYGQSLLVRGESGLRPSRSEEGSVAASEHGIIKSKSSSSVSRAGGDRLGNRFRTSSDASLSEALGRLEGKRNQDALVAQISHLGSTRARSPHRGHRAFKENIDEVPPPPLPTPKSNFRQQLQQQRSFTRKLNDLGTYGERLQQLQQQSR